ncbi:hypothetical protein A6E01_20805 (plasmid) [Vibrio breoganii]|uniref:Metal-dependent hydrolase n=1 Tax=Vibrio breoganii TaxID=553239 RepID=A0AAN0XZS7_9VIBR|nr:metal-dependent hydrolase [Vibrio breoganii]ANO35654.1 hypothetical protein A6E01_20805 [Vibrio breoganii]
MNNQGHALCGIAGAIYPLTYVSNQTDPIHGALAAIACLAGSLAPDALEIPIPIKKDKKTIGHRRLLRHRGWTHITIVWITLFLLSSLAISGALTYSINSWLLASTVGFTFGGILHVLGDMPNTHKVPLFTPWDGYCLNLFKSGRYQKSQAILILLGSWLLVHNNIFPDALLTNS